MYIHMLTPIILKSKKPALVCVCEADNFDDVYCDMIYAVPVDKDRRLFPEYKAVTILYDGLGKYRPSEDLKITRLGSNLVMKTPYGNSYFKTVRINRCKYMFYAGKEKHEDFKYELTTMAQYDEKHVLERMFKEEKRIFLGASGVH